MSGRRHHDRKPYERPPHGSNASSSSSRWRSKNLEENQNNESFISQMTSSVTGLFSKSWSITNWFKSKENASNINQGASCSHSDESISIHPAGESFIFSKTELKSPNFKQIYPEEGEQDEKDDSAPSTSEGGVLLKDHRRNRRCDQDSPELFFSEGSLSFPSLRKTNHPGLISSTPAPSTSKESLDRKKNIILDDDLSGEAMPELEDVSLIAHPGGETTIRDLDNEDKSISRFSTSAHFSSGSRPPLPDRKRRRESYEETSPSTEETNNILPSNSFSQTPRNHPQQGALANKRPRFNLSAYTSLHNNSSFMDSSSLFYPGRTTYGGANNFRRSSNTPTFSKTVPQAQVRVQNSNNMPEDGGLSVAAKRILDCLNKMSTPLSNAKRIPSARPKTYLFDSPSYIADFHRHRPTLRAERTTPSSTPPTSKLLTPRQASVKENVSSLLEPSPSISKASKVNSITPSTTSTSLNMAKPASAKIQTSVIVTSKNDASVSQTSKSEIAPFSFGLTTTSISTASYANTPKSSFISTNARTSPVEDIRRQTSFKIKTSKKGSENILEENVVIPDLPEISFPITSMPKIDFGLSKIPATTSPPVSNVNEFENFKFCEPVLVSSHVDMSHEDNLETIDNFIFSQPVFENEVDNLHSAIDSQSPHHQSVFTSNVKKDSSQPTFGKSSSPTSEVLIPTSCSDVQIISTPSWGDKFKAPMDSWECSLCLVRNKSSNMECVACQFPKPDISKKAKNTALIPEHSSMVIIGPTSTSKSSEGFGNLFKKPTNEWTCDVCMINNKDSEDKCVACQSSKPGSKPTPPQPVANIPKSSGFGDLFKKPSNEWTCDVCMLNNKNELTQCIACQSPKPGSSMETLSESNFSSTSFPQQSGFGSQFLMPKDEWECPTCLVRNKTSAKNCLSCSTPSSQENNNIVSKAMTGNFKFGVPTNTFNFGIPKSDSGEAKSTGFTFGIASTTNDSSSQSTTNQKDSSGFKFSSTSKSGSTFSFGVPSQSSLSSSTITTSTSSSTSVQFSFGSKQDTLTTAVGSANSSSIKTGQSVPAFEFKSALIKPSETTSSTKESLLPFGSGFPKSSVVTDSTSTVVTTASGFGKLSRSKETQNTSYLPTTATICSVIVTSPKAVSQAVSSTALSTATTSSIFPSSITSTSLSPFSISSASNPLTTSSSSSAMFTFGASSKHSVSSNASSTANSSIFSFGKGSSTSGVFSFGSTNSSAKSKMNKELPPPSYASTISSAFSLTSSGPLENTTALSTSSSTFPTTSSTKFAFGGIPSSNIFSFGQPSSSSCVSVSSSGFNFSKPTASIGSTATTSTTSTASSIFSFGAPSQSAVTSSGFGFPSASPSSAFLSTASTPSTQTTNSNSNPACFAFGQTQEKKNNAGFNFGQASVGASSTDFNFGVSNPTTNPEASSGLFSFQGASSFTPRTNTYVLKENTEQNAFSLSTQNAFTALSNPHSSTVPHNRVIKKALRRGKNKT